MDEIFNNINPEKRDRIINSALEEFCKNRYEKASTNNIVKNANISKGLLYHYFTSKKKLYEFLEIFVIKTIAKTIDEKVDWNESDFFKRLKRIVIVKLEITNSYPHIYDFAMVMYENKSIEEVKKISERFSPDILHRTYHYNIDYSKFRDDMDKEKVISVIRWTFEKYGEQFVRQSNLTNDDIDYKHIEKEIDEYIEILRNAFYK